MSKKYSLLFALFIGVLMVGVYLYYQNSSIIQVRTEISPVDDVTYETISGLESVAHPEQEHFKKLVFTFTFHYTEEVEEYHLNLPEFNQLLGHDIYWTGGFYEFDDTEKNEFIREEEIIIYTGEVSNREIINLLSKGTVILTWRENGEDYLKEYNIGESVVFLK